MSALLRYRNGSHNPDCRGRVFKFLFYRSERSFNHFAVAAFQYKGTSSKVIFPAFILFP